MLDRLASADDATLVERAQDGDVVAFEVLVRLHAPTTRAMARRVLDGDTALAALPAPVRRAWLFREQAGLSCDEIARLEQVGVDTVRGRIARARSSLVKQMGAWR